MSEAIKELIKKVGSTGYNDGSSLNPGWLYSPLPFAEYSDTPVHKTNCIDEYQTIIKSYDFTDKTVMDIGSAGGWFTFNIAKTAKIVYAFEADPEMNAVIQAIKQEQGIKNVILYDKFDIKSSFAMHQDCVLMLNVHQWLVKQNGFEGTKEILKNLSKTKPTLFFQTAHAESSAMFKVEELKDKQGIADYLTECGFKPELLKESLHDGRPRYLFKA